jgi:hypothetical protein
MNYRRFFWCLAIAFVTLLAAEASGCPTCKQALLTSGNNMNLVRGFGWSIIFMLSVPFLILAGLGGYFYFLVQRAAQDNSTAADAPLAPSPIKPVGSF